MNEPKDSSGGWDGYRTFCVERKEPAIRSSPEHDTTTGGQRCSCHRGAARLAVLPLPRSRDGIEGHELAYVGIENFAIR